MDTIERKEFEAIALALCQSIDDAHRGMSSNKAKLLAGIREFDKLELANEVGTRTTAQWLMRRYGMSSSTAHEYVNVAHRLGMFRYLEQRFKEGVISYSVVRLLLKYLTEENEEELVNLACEMGYHQLEVMLAGHTKQGEGEEELPGYYLRLHQEPDGSLRLHGRLNPVDAAAFKAGLKLGEIAHCNLDELFDGSEQVVPEESIDEAMDRAMEVEPAKPTKKTASGYGLPIGRMLLKALMGLVHIARATHTNTLLAPGAHVNVIATKDGRAYMPNNLGAPNAALAHLISNAFVRLSRVDEHGLIINTGRASRLASAAQVNALLTMWGGQCAAPGCTHSRFIEMHHIHEWADGGPTDLENLLPLCSSCHSLVTEGYLGIEKDGHDIHFSYRDGARYVSANYSMPRRDDTAVSMAEYERLVDEEMSFEAV